MVNFRLTLNENTDILKNTDKDTGENIKMYAIALLQSRCSLALASIPKHALNSNNYNSLFFLFYNKVFKAVYKLREASINPNSYGCLRA